MRNANCPCECHNVCGFPCEGNSCCIRGVCDFDRPEHETAEPPASPARQEHPRRLSDEALAAQRELLEFAT